MTDRRERYVLFGVALLVLWALLSSPARADDSPDRDPGDFGGFGGGDFGGGGAGGGWGASGVFG